MARVLTIDEMLDVATALPGDKGGEFVTAVEALGTELAQYIADTLGIDCTDAAYEGTAFAGTCANFSPKTPGQPIPAEIEFFDPDGGWDD